MSIFTVKTSTKSDKIEAFQATVCEFGLAVPALYGRCKTAPNLINYQDFTAKEKKETKHNGKAKNTTTTYLYSAYIELALGTPIESVLGIWVGEDKYNSLAALNSAGSDVAGQPLSLNLGNDSNPTVYMSEKHADIAVGYSDLSYLYGYVFLGEDSASCPSYQVEVQGALGSTGDGVDANPAYIIRDILSKLGLANYIDETSFSNYALYCKEADMLVSTPSGKFNEQRKAQEICKELLNLTNTYMYWNSDRFVFVPRESEAQGGWQPNQNIVYDLDADDLALNNGGIVEFKRKPSSEIYNYVTVKFTNRNNDYETESVSFQNVDDIREHGAKSVEIEALWLHTKERAIKFARAYARKCQTEINQYTLKLDWAFCRLTAGDLIRVTDETLGLQQQVMMVSEVAEDANGLLTVTAIQRENIAGAQPVYTIADDYNKLYFNIAPSDTVEPVFITPPAEMITSSSGLELWIALRGTDDRWGGCQVLVSDKDSDYTFNGLQDVNAVMGYPRSTITDSTKNITVQFYNYNVVSIPTDEADENTNFLNRLLWVDGEIISYDRAVLTDTRNRYTLYGIDNHRGMLGTTKANHVYGTSVNVVVLDSNLYAMPLPAQHDNKKLYFKFPAFNVFQKNVQDVNELTSYERIVTSSDAVPNQPLNCTITYGEKAIVSWSNVTNTVISRYELRSSATIDAANLLYSGTNNSAELALTERTGTLYLYAVNKNNKYSEALTLTYNKPAPAAPSFTAVPNIKSISLGVTEIPADCKAVKYSLMGASHSYTVTTKEQQKVVNVEADIYTITAAYEDMFGVGATSTLTVTIKATIDESMFANESISAEKLSKAANDALALANSAVQPSALNDYATINALTQTSNEWTNLLGTYTKGDGCLIPVETYKGALGNITAGATLTKTGGTAYWAAAFNVTAGATYYIITQMAYSAYMVIYTDENDVVIGREGSGSIFYGTSSKYKTYDIAEGYVVVPDTATKMWVRARANTTNNQQDWSACLKVRKATSVYSTISQLNDAIGFQVVSNGASVDGDKLISAINLGKGTVSIAGKYVHITGDTVFDNNVIVNGTWNGNAIAANKIAVDNLSALSATMGHIRTAATGARIEIGRNAGKLNLLEVLDTNNVVRVKLGEW